MMRAILQPFAPNLGAPMSPLGLLESLAGLRGLPAAPLQYDRGWLSDHLGCKPLMILDNMAGLLGISLFIVAALTGNWLRLMPVVLIEEPLHQADTYDQAVRATGSQDWCRVLPAPSIAAPLDDAT